MEKFSTKGVLGEEFTSQPTFSLLEYFITLISFRTRLRWRPLFSICFNIPSCHVRKCKAQDGRAKMTAKRKIPHTSATDASKAKAAAIFLLHVDCGSRIDGAFVVIDPQSMKITVVAAAVSESAVLLQAYIRA